MPARENEGRGNRLTLEEVRHFSKEQLQILQKASLKPSRLSKFLEDVLKVETSQKLCQSSDHDTNHRNIDECL